MVASAAKACQDSNQTVSIRLTNARLAEALNVLLCLLIEVALGGLIALTGKRL